MNFNLKVSLRNIMLLFALTFCASAAFAGTIAFVHAADTLNSSGGSSVSATLANTAGDALVAVCRQGNDATSITSVSDSAGNSYSLVNKASDSGGGGTRETAVYLAINIKTSSSNTVSCNFASSLSKTVGIVVEEFSNVASLDANLVVTSNGSGVTSLSSGTLTTTHSGDAMVFALTTSATVTWTAGSGYTIPTNGSDGEQAAQYAIVGAAGGYSTSISWSASADGDAIYLALAPTASSSSIAFVRAADTLNTSGGSSVTASLANTAGDALVAVCRQGNDATSISSVSDSAGNSYSLVNKASDSGGGGTRETAVYLAVNIKTSSSNAVSCNFASNLSKTVGIVVEEFSNVASLDADLVITSNGSAVTSLSSGTLTTTHSGDAMIFALTTSATVTWTAGSGYTIPTNGSDGEQVAQYAVVGAAGGYSTSISWSASADGDAIYLALAPTGGSGGAPPTPTNLAATPGNAQVALTWNTSTGATSYNVKRSTTSGGPYTTIASPTTNGYTDTGVTNGTTYYYVVSAVDSGGESANSSQVSATPTSGTADFTIAVMPSSQTISPGGQAPYTVTITAVNGFNGVVDLTASGLPTDASAAFNPTTITGSGTSTMTVTTTSGIATGTSTLTAKGTSGSLTHSATTQLVVSSASITVNFSSPIATLDPYGFAVDITGYGNLTTNTTEQSMLKTLGAPYMRMGLQYATSGNANSQIECDGTGCITSVTGDAWITAIKSTGAIPAVITSINSTNYHADAVNLVTHFNSNPPNPSNPNYVKYWIIGNEPDINGVTSATYVSKFNELYAAMKAIDPNILIGGPAVAGFADPTTLPSNPCDHGTSSNYQYLQDFLNGSGAYVDFVDFHKYDTGSTTSSSQAAGFLANTCRYGLRIAQIRNYLNTFSTTQSRANSIDIEIGEWNLTSDGTDTGLTYQEFNTVYSASALGYIMNNGARGLMYGDQNGPLSMISDGSNGSGTNNGMPIYWGYAMYTGAGLFRTYGTTSVATSTTLSNVDVFASTNGNSIVVVNKDPNNTQNATFALTGYISGSADVWQKSNSFGPYIAPQKLGAATITNGEFTYSLPPYSVTTFVLQ